MSQYKQHFTDDELAELANGFPEKYRDILYYLDEWSESVPCISDVAAWVELPFIQTRNALREMAKRKVIEFGTLYSLDNENQRHGSGYYSSHLTRQFLRYLKEKTHDDHCRDYRG